MAKTARMDIPTLVDWIKSGASVEYTEAALEKMRPKDFREAWDAYLAAQSPEDKKTDGPRKNTSRTCHVVLLSAEGEIMERDSVDNIKRLDKAALVESFEAAAAFSEGSSVLVMVESEDSVEVVGVTAEQMLGLLSR